MILNQKSEDEVISSLESSSFEISAQNVGLLFSTISEGLYSNPISSIVREITSNAVDATVEAGKIDPVVVELQKDISGYYLKIQDFGVGISEERIENTYKKLFESTKRQSNDYIGAYGIGRFSIFSYTNSYYLTTVYDGYKYEYQLFLQNSIPDIILLDKSETDDSNGTSVKIPIETKDVYHFSTAIRQTLLYFNNVYIIDCVRGFDNNDFKILREGNYLHNPLSTHTELHLSVGGVYYPIDWNSISEDRIELNVAIELPNGSVDTTRSRENIRYTEKTTAIIQNVVRQFRDYIENKYVDINPDINLETADFKNLCLVGKNITCIELFNQPFVVDHVIPYIKKQYRLLYCGTQVPMHTCFPFVIEKYSYYSKRGKYLSKIDSISQLFSLLKNNENKYWYLFNSEKTPLSKKLAKLRYNGTALLITPKKFNSELSLNKQFFVQNNLTVREHYQYWIDFICLLKSKLNIKHVSEYQEPKKAVIDFYDAAKYYLNGDLSKYGPNSKTKNILYLCNLSKEKAEFISAIYKHTWLCVYKIPKSELESRQNHIKTMSELLETNKFHKLMFYYKLKQQFPDFQMSVVKPYVSLDYLQNFEDFDITPPVSEFMNELLQEYEAKYPLDNLEYIVEKFRNLEEFAIIMDSISHLSMESMYRILRAVAKAFKIKLKHEIENTDVITKVMNLFSLYSSASLGYNSRNKVQIYVKELLGDNDDRPFELQLYTVLKDFDIKSVIDLHTLAENNFTLTPTTENEVHSN